MASSPVMAGPSAPHLMDRFEEIDAARALLGVHPSSSTSSRPVDDVNAEVTAANVDSSNTRNRIAHASSLLSLSSGLDAMKKDRPSGGSADSPSTSLVQTGEQARDGGSTSTANPAREEERQQHEENKEPGTAGRSRVGADCVGLNALVALASREQASLGLKDGQQQQRRRPIAPFLVGSAISSSSCSSSSSDDDSEACNNNSSSKKESMPPPPPRRVGRRRSASNPEGMEKWDSLSMNKQRSSRRHFMLPASILEEELAQASRAVEERRQPRKDKDGQDMDIEMGNAADDSTATTTTNKRVRDEGTTQHGTDLEGDSKCLSGGEGSALTNMDDNDNSYYDEENMTPEELLRRARSRLLEDLSEGNVSGERGVLTLPHSLSKYKHVYNQGGRIGIYTPAERAAIISRFNRKRGRRVWNKKIRYNCRKSLADRRMRVKGRFVKRSEQEELVKKQQQKLKQEEQPEEEQQQHDDGESMMMIPEKEVVNSNDQAKSITTTTTKPIKLRKTSMRKKTKKVSEEEEGGADDVIVEDTNMPDVNDPEAGFAPTAEQPYRRLRRHTIT